MTVHVSGLDEGAPIFDEGLAPAKLLELLPGDDEAADPPEFPGGDPVATPDEDPTPLSEDICNCFFLASSRSACMLDDGPRAVDPKGELLPVALDSMGSDIRPSPPAPGGVGEVRAVIE